MNEEKREERIGDTAQWVREAASGNDCVRLEAAQRLGSCGPAALPALAALAWDPNDYVRMAARASVYDLARRTGDLQATRLGLRAATDGNLHLRRAAWRGLKRLPRAQIRAAFEPPTPPPGFGIDCLHRCLIPATSEGCSLVPTACEGRRCQVCVALLATPGFEGLLDMCLLSLKKNAGLEGLDVTYVAFVPGADDACRAVCRRHDAVCVEPLALVPPHASMKGVIYSLPRWVDADCYLSIEPDVLVLGSLREIVDGVLADRRGRLFAVPSFVTLEQRNRAVRESGRWRPDPQGVITSLFDGDGDDLRFLLGDRPVRVEAFCNGGLFLGNGEALRRVEEEILSLQPFASLWIDTGLVHWREEMVWNLAYSLAGSLAPLPKRYNFEPQGQLGPGWLRDPDADTVLPLATGGDPPVDLPRHVRAVHFMGRMKEQMPRYLRAYGISPGVPAEDRGEPAGRPREDAGRSKTREEMHPGEEVDPGEETGLRTESGPETE